jgi:CheY-like chemotaxis protein
MSQNSSILVIDDDIDNKVILSDYFKDAGYDDSFMFVDAGDKAIQYLESTSDQLPQLIVLDLNMPKINGTDTLRYLKQSPSLCNIPVIIFSTSNNEVERKRCLGFGATDYIVKPYSIAEGVRVANTFVSYVH